MQSKVSRGFLVAFAVALVTGCGSGAHDASLPVAQNNPAALSPAEMDAIYPKSPSPASFKAAPLPRTAILPPSAMKTVPGAVTPQSVGPLNWSQVSGASSQVAVAPDGSVWALSDDPAGSVDKNIWHLANNAWTNVSGEGSSIAVGPTGTVYIVDATTNDVYSSSNDGASWTYLGGGARYVTAGADGSVYVLSSSGVVNGNSAVWKYKSGTWTQQPGSGSLLQKSYDPIAYTVAGVGKVVPDGYFLLTSAGATYYYSPGVGYVQFPGTASGIATVPGGFFELDYPASAAGEGLAYFNYASATLTAEPGTGVSLALGPGSDGVGLQLYEVNSRDILWTTAVADTAITPDPAFNDYSTFGYDNQRDVYNPNSTAITPATVANLHLAWQAALDGGEDFSTQTQPILATEIGGHSGVLFVGGGSGNVYAYDATSGALLWTKNFGQESYHCGATYTGILGIGGTAAYDPATRSLYVVGNANTSVGAYAKNTLYHLDAATGATLGSVVFTPNPAGATELDFGHTSVTLSGGTAYVGTGSFCDISSWRGRVVAVNVPSMTIANTFFTLWDPTNARGQGAQPWGGGGIWGWGGVSLDPAGNVLTAVGNGDAGGNFGTIAPPFVQMPTEHSGYAESVLELSSNLSKVIASNHPTPASVYAGAEDVDVQGTPVVFTPSGCATMIAGQDKAGELTMYDESSINGGPVKQFQMGPSSATDYFIGEPAYSPVTGLVYSDVAASAAPSLFSPGLVAVNPGCGKPAITWQAAFGSSADAPRSVPAVSAGGVVFAGAGKSVWALNATTGAILSGGQPFLQTGGSLRMPATIDGNWVFILDNNGNLYGLTTDPRFATVKAQFRSPTARQRATWVEKSHV